MSLTPAQLAMRNTGIGASEIGAALGLSRWETPLGIYLRKIGETPEFEGNEATEAGLELEPAIATWAAKKLGNPPTHEEGTVRHPEHSFIFATPDRIFDDRSAILQIKNVGFHMRHEWGDDGDDVPHAYRVQIEWEMIAVGIKRAWLAVCIGGQRLRIYGFDQDPSMSESLIRQAHHFWHEHVLARVPPPIDGAEKTRRWLESKHPGHFGNARAIEWQEAEWCADYLRAIAMEKEAKETKALLGNRLRAALGDHEGAEGHGVKVTWTQNENGTPSWKAIAEEAGATPDLIAKHTPPGPHVLRVTSTAKKQRKVA